MVKTDDRSLVQRSGAGLLRFIFICIAGLGLAACDQVTPVGTAGGAGTTGQAAPQDRWSRALQALVESPSVNAGLPGAGSAPLRDVYQQTGYRPLWHSRGTFKPEAQQAIALMAKAGEEGIENFYFLPPELRQGGQVGNTNDPAAAAATEAMLTSAFLVYARDVSAGRFNPKQQPLPTDGMAKAALENRLGSWIYTRAPDGLSYRQLKTALITQQQDLSDRQRGLIRLNMERQRWRGEPDGGKFVRVNIPGQELEAFNGDVSELKMNVVVGRPSRPTPVMNDRIYSLKYSPDWTIPKTVITEDFIPKLKANRSYLKNNGYEVFSRGTLVDSTSIDPDKLLNYTVRRPPGGQNPLGGVRFSLTNGQAIYLHDSPGSSQYTRDSRALSSGCVRVADAPALAKWVHSAQGQSVSQGQIKSRMSLPEPKTISLNSRIPVALAYMTAWVDGSGKLRFAKDIYGKDSALAAKMGLSL